MAKSRSDRVGNESPPSVDGISNPTTVGDGVRHVTSQKQQSQVSIDNKRASINNSENPSGFFEQLFNLVGSDPSLQSDNIQDADADLDDFENRFIAANDRNPTFAESKAEKARLQEEYRLQDLKADQALRNTRYSKVAYADEIDRSPPAVPEESIELVGSKLVRYAEDFEEEAREESDGPVFLIDALIFIQGVEVSEYLQGQVRISLNGTTGYNTAVFTLDNSSDRFVWTERNLVKTHGRSAVRAKADFYREFVEANREEIEARVSEERSTGIFAPNINQATKGTEFELNIDRTLATKAVTTGLMNARAFNQQEQLKQEVYTYKADPSRNPPIKNPKNALTHARFDLVPNTPIFSKMDPIRIFALYPWRVPGKEYETETLANAQGDIDQGDFVVSKRPELWMPEFTGYVWNVSVEEDNTNGGSRLTINCVDFREAVLRRMRISADLSSSLAAPLNALGFQVSPTTQVGGRSAVLPQDQLYQQQFKDNTEGWYNINNTQFYDDIIATKFNQPFPNKSLEEAVRDLLVAKGEIKAEKNNRGVRGVEFGGNFFYNAKQPRTEARKFLESWHKFCLFGPKRRPWTRTEVEEVGSKTTTDGDYAPNKVRLWFLLPSSGSGPKNLADLSQISISLSHDVNWTNRQEILTNIVESIDYNFMVSPTGDLICEFQMADFRPEDFGEFAKTFRFDKHLVSTNFTDDQQSPPAGLIVSTNFALGKSSTGSGIADARLTKTFVYSPYIAARYGIEIQNESIPFLLARDKRIAQQRAVMLYQRRLARSRALTFTSTYRPCLLPNRPVHHIKRTRIGSVVTVDKMLSVTAQPKGETVVGLEHVRTFTGHYRSLHDFQTLNEDQQQDISTKGQDPGNTEDLAGIDSLDAADPIELQVYTTVAAGESTPTSARVGWSDAAVLAPASGIYILDLDTNTRVTSEDLTQQPVDETQAEDVGDAVEDVEEETEEEPPLNKFKENPLATMTLLSPYGLRYHPIEKKNKLHAGIDLRGAIGTDILAVEDAVILKARSQIAPAHPINGSVMNYGTGGNILLMKTKRQGVLIQMLHLDDSSRELGLKFGQEVKAGQVIGKVGNTGGSTGPHLHFELITTKTSKAAGVTKTSDKKIDPVDWFPGPIEDPKGNS